MLLLTLSLCYLDIYLGLRLYTQYLSSFQCSLCKCIEVRLKQLETERERVSELHSEPELELEIVKKYTYTPTHTHTYSHVIQQNTNNGNTHTTTTRSGKLLCTVGRECAKEKERDRDREKVMRCASRRYFRYLYSFFSSTFC